MLCFYMNTHLPPPPPPSPSSSAPQVSPEDVGRYAQLIRALRNGSDVADFPVDHPRRMSKLRECVTLARQIDAVEHAQRDRKVEHDWARRTADMADLPLSSDEEDKDAPYAKNSIKAAARKSKKGISESVDLAKVARLREQLTAALSQPVIEHAFHGGYITRQLPAAPASSAAAEAFKGAKGKGKAKANASNTNGKGTGAQGAGRAQGGAGGGGGGKKRAATPNGDYAPLGKHVPSMLQANALSALDVADRSRRASKPGKQLPRRVRK